jgi:hypothetical protein
VSLGSVDHPALSACADPPPGVRRSRWVFWRVDRHIYQYVSAHRKGARYLMAAQSWSQASPYILATGQEVLPMGGFSGLVPEPALARVRRRRPACRATMG